jgi:hypothetical protein
MSGTLVTENSVSNVKKINHGLPFGQNNMNGVNWILKRKKIASNELTLQKQIKSKLKFFIITSIYFKFFFYKIVIQECELILQG